MKRLAGLLFSALLLVAIPCLAGDGGKIKVAVMEFSAKSGVTQAQADSLNDLVASQIADMGKYQVITKADINSMLSMEEHKIQLTGCADDACLAEIGGALGVNLLVSGNLAQFGDVFLINLRLVDSGKAQAVARSSREIKGGQSALPAEVRAAVAELFATSSADQAPTGTVAAEPERETMGAMNIIPWITLGLAVAAAGAGGVVMGLGGSDYKSMDDEFRKSDPWEDLKDSGDTKIMAGGILVGVGGAAAVATLILFLVGGDGEPDKAVSFVPVEGGAVGAFSVQF